MKKNRKPFEIELFGKDYKVPLNLLKDLGFKEDDIINKAKVKEVLELKINRCKGPEKKGVKGCSECSFFNICKDTKLYYSTPTPKYIYRIFMPRLTGAEWKVFSYLDNEADFSSSSRAFGQCTRTREQIAKGTGLGVSKISRYTKYLEKIGLISKAAEYVNGNETRMLIN